MLSIILRAMKISIAALAAALCFEVLKHSIHPTISTLASHASWVLFYTLSAFAVSVVMLLREERDLAGLIEDLNRRRILEQELRLQTSALDAAANAIVITDREGLIVWVNRAFTDLTGFEAEEVLGQTPRVLHSARHDIAFYSHLWQTIKGGGVWRGEIINRRKDGECYVEEMTITPVKSEQGEVTHFIAIKVDVTTRKNTEETLIRSESILRSMVQNAPYGIFRVRPDGTILSANPAVCRILGYDSEADLLSINMSAVYFNPADRPPIVERVLNEGDVQKIETRWKRKDNIEVTVRLGGHRISSADDSGPLLECYAVDITQSNQAQRELLRLNRALKTLSKCNETLVYATNETQLLSDVCETIVNLGGYRFAWVGFAEEVTSVVRPVAKAGLDDGYIEKAHITFADCERGRGPVGTAIRENRVTILRNTSTDPEFGPWREEATRRGYSSIISLPLQDGHQTLGALTIYSSEPDAFDSQEIDLMKQLANDLAYGIVSLRNAENRARTERALRSSEERYRTLYDHNLAAVFHSIDGKLLDCNEAMCRMLGYSREELCALDLRVLYHDPAAREIGKQLLMEQGSLSNYEVDLRRKDGSLVRVIANLNLMQENPSDSPLVTGVMLDVSEVRKLQEQLVQSQKLEAIGKLTGGIAHDFNNILMIMNSYSELILDALDTDSPLRNYAQQVRVAGDRAASLTRQLLAFSRKQVMTPTHFKVDSILSTFKPLLKRLIGEDLALEIHADTGIWTVNADISQIEQVLLNLVVNARDSMPDGGRLTIRACNVELDESFVAIHPGSKAGPHICLQVNDTGHGMSPEVQSRIFEPFFTTKGVGKGTGLGLSTVYGIVKQSGGYITVESETGIGTKFNVYLPRAIETEMQSSVEEPVKDATPRPKILVVEDEEATREAINTYLELNGFSVVSTSKPLEALEMIKDGASHFDVLLTDVVMPCLSGVELAKSFRSRFPSSQVIFMSGYTDEVLIRSGIEHPQTSLLPKPFGLVDLVGKLRSLLETRDRGV
jgi:two-component system, cell cycle sensor histidine kinase and response regulator CckA